MNKGDDYITILKANYDQTRGFPTATTGMVGETQKNFISISPFPPPGIYHNI